MSNENNANDWSVISDYVLPADRRGPPENWQHATWFDFKRRQWWYRFAEGWREDPPPVETLGYKGGEFVFVSAAREIRRFTATHLFGKGGAPDLFAGDLDWAVRHYPAKDRNGELVDRPNVHLLMEAMIRACAAAGYYDGSIPFRGIGTWRGPDGQPVVHAGGTIFWNGTVYRPGERIGTDRYMIGSNRPPPAHERISDRTYRWLPADVGACHTIMSHLDEWHWVDENARDLFAGGLWCDMLGDAPVWKPHKFVRAPASAGKTTLLKYVRELLGGQAHGIQRSYSPAHLEDVFNHSACAFLLEEAEGQKGSEADDRMRRVLDLALLLSDEGAVGGRFKREIDLHGTFTLIATLTEEWRTTIKSRMTLLELRRLRDRTDRPLATREHIAAITAQASTLSAGLRARALATYPLFQENLRLAQAKILKMGGSPRDADQLGHLIAGWVTMTGDEPMTEDDVGRLERFRDYVLTIADAENAADDPNDCWNTLLGLPADRSWRGGEQLTIGELVLKARDPLGDEHRRSLKRYGLMLVKLPQESWPDAWLAVANKHPGLDKLFTDYPQYQGQKRSQILCELRRTVNGVEYEPKPTEGSLRFLGPQSRAWLIPPELLPSAKDDDEASPRAPDAAA